MRRRRRRRRRTGHRRSEVGKLICRGTSPLSDLPPYVETTSVPSAEERWTRSKNNENHCISEHTTGSFNWKAMPIYVE